jgi:hypothetical protein
MNKENHFTTVYDEISAQKLCAGMMSKGARHAGREGFYTAVTINSGYAQAITVLQMHHNIYIALQKTRLYRSFIKNARAC